MPDSMLRKQHQATGVVAHTSTKDASDEEYEAIKVPISSTGVDRDGDEFSEEGLEDLRDQIRSQSRPVFGNHGAGDGGLFGVRYDWKDIIGSLDDAEIVSEDGVDVLYGYIRPNPENERATQLLAYIKAEMPVGFSIGFGVAEKDEKDAGGYIFHSTDLMEVSSVGIQSNRESVANAASSAVAMAKAAGDVTGGDVDETVLAKAIVDGLLEHRDVRGDQGPDAPSEWAANHFSAEQDPNGSPATRSMGDDTTTDSDDDELAELLERNTDAVDELRDTIDGLQGAITALAKADDEDDDGSDDDDDDDEPGEDDEDDGEDGKQTTPGVGKNEVIVSAADEAQIKALREAADENGKLDLKDSETTVALVDDEDEPGEKDDDTTSEKGVF